MSLRRCSSVVERRSELPAGDLTLEDGTSLRIDPSGAASP